MKVKQDTIKKAKHIYTCHYCIGIMNKNKLIDCSSCGNKFCTHCLTDISRNKILCNPCLIKYAKEDVILFVEK